MQEIKQDDKKLNNNKGTFGTLNGDYDRNCNLYYR